MNNLQHCIYCIMTRDMKMHHNFKNKGLAYFRQSTIIFLWSVIILEEVKDVLIKIPHLYLSIIISCMWQHLTFYTKSEMSINLLHKKRTKLTEPSSFLWRIWTTVFSLFSQWRLFHIHKLTINEHAVFIIEMPVG